jgi:hypothetical protein
MKYHAFGKINLNQVVNIVLQPRGVEALRKHYRKMLLPAPEHAVGDTYSGPLWEVMVIFGGSCFMGPEPPFETTFEIEGFPHESWQRHRESQAAGQARESKEIHGSEDSERSFASLQLRRHDPH